MKWHSLKEVKEQTDHQSVYPWNWKILTSTGHIPSYFFANLIPLTPNQVTLFWGIFGLLGISVIALGGYVNMLIGILVYQLAIWIDTADGTVARLTGIKTSGGPYLDYFFHNTHRALLLFALGLGLFNSSGDIFFLYVGIWCSFFLVFDNLYKMKIYESFSIINRFDLIKKFNNYLGGGEGGYHQERKNWKKKVNFYTREMIRPNNPFTLLFFSILFNVPHWYLILIAVLSPMLFMNNSIKIYRKFGTIDFSKKTN